MATDGRTGRSVWEPARAGKRIDELAHLPGALLPVLHAIQEEFGFIPQESVALIAERLNLSIAEVHGVISFYHDFRRQPAGRHVLKLCRAEACQSVGADQLIHHVEKQASIKLGETTADGALTVEQVFCLGNCALSPAALLDGKPYGRLTREKVDVLIRAMTGAARS